MTLAVVARHARSAPLATHEVVSSPVPQVVPVSPTSRRVVVPLPFVARRVTFDETQRELDPAADVVAFDVPTENGSRHWIAAQSTDGTRAEGYVREQEGIARPVDGLAYSFPSAPVGSEAQRDVGHAGGRVLHSIGKVHDGFTKLK